MITKWQLPATAYQRIEQIVQGGSITLKASRDLTCELPITIIIDTTDNELFCSVNVLTTRKTLTLEITATTLKNNISNQVYNFVVTTLETATTKEAKSD